MLRFRLCDTDRERLGCGEWLELDPYSLTAREASILQRGFDLDGETVTYAHPGLWRAALSTPVGQPPEYPAVMVMVWLALRRADITVPLSALDFNLDGLAYARAQAPAADPEPEADPDVSPGKDDGPETSPSGSGESTTSPA